MPPIVRKASGSPPSVQLESGYQVNWQAGVGETWTRSEVGNRDHLYDTLQGLKETHDSAVLSPGKTPHDWTLTATVTDASVRVDTFDLSSQQLQQSVFTSERVLNAVGGTANMNKVRGAANAVRNSAGTNTAEEAYNLAIDEIADAIPDPTQQDNAYALFDLLIRDTDTIANWTYYFTWQISLSRWDDADRIDFSQVGKVFSKTNLINFTGYTGSAGSLPDFEWLMEAPSDNITLGQRRVITFRWIGAETWSRLLYDEVEGEALP